jgi:DinB superfamily
MKEENIFKQLETVRSVTVELLESIPESNWDVIPEGFRNNIRWNAGHILTIQDLLANDFRSISENLPDKYLAYFSKDTSPSNWTEQPPSKEELLKLLKEQSAWIRTACEGKLEQKLDKPFRGFETLGELLLFGSFHDGMHTGIINAQNKIVSEHR